MCIIVMQSLRIIVKSVFGGLSGHKNFHPSLDISNFRCLVGRVGLSGHCQPRANKDCQLDRVVKLKSSFTTQPS
jgi:hypothetical protein